MNKWLEIFLGLIMVVIPLTLILPGMPLSNWGRAALIILKGGIVWVVLLTGLLLIILGINELKE